MKLSYKNPAVKLTEKFDRELRSLLVSELKSSRRPIIRRLRNDDGGFLVA